MKEFQNDKPIFLFMGDSHMQTAFNPNEIDNSFNIASSAEHYLYTYSKLKIILENGVKVEKVILGVGPHNFGRIYDDFVSRSTRSAEMYKRFSSVLGLEESKWILKRDPGNFLVQTGTSLNEAIGAMVKKDSLRLRAWGHFRFSLNSNLNDTLLNKRLNDHYDLQNAHENKLSQTQLEYLKRINDLCSMNDVELVFVNTPVHESYRSQIPLEFTEHVQQSLQVNFNREYLDYGGQKFGDDFFGDVDHLNTKGAEAFHEVLLKEQPSLFEID